MRRPRPLPRQRFVILSLLVAFLAAPYVPASALPGLGGGVINAYGGLEAETYDASTGWCDPNHELEFTQVKSDPARSRGAYAFIPYVECGIEWNSLVFPTTGGFTSLRFRLTGADPKEVDAWVMVDGAIGSYARLYQMPGPAHWQWASFPTVNPMPAGSHHVEVVYLPVGWTPAETNFEIDCLHFDADPSWGGDCYEDELCGTNPLGCCSPTQPRCEPPPPECDPNKDPERCCDEEYPPPECECPDGNCQPPPCDPATDPNGCCDTENPPPECEGTVCDPKTNPDCCPDGTYDCHDQCTDNSTYCEPACEPTPNEPCPPPVWDDPYDPCGEERHARVGDMLHEHVQASSPGYRLVTLDESVVPVGTFVYATASWANPVHAVWDWKPGVADVGVHTLQFVAKDDLGQYATSCDLTVYVTP